MLQSLEVYKLFGMVRSFIEATVKNSSVYIYIPLSQSFPRSVGTYEQPVK